MEYLIVVNDLDKKRIIKEASKHSSFFKGKIMGYKELMKHLYFDYSEETYFYISSKYKVSKEVAEIYVQNLYLIDSSAASSPKLSFLKDLYQELLNQNLLIINKLWKEKIKNVKIVFYHLNHQDKYFQRVVTDCGKLTQIEIQDIEEQEQQKIVLTKYATIEDEVIGVCNKICDLLKQGYLETDIFLSNLREEHYKYFDIYANMFHLNLNLRKKETYFSSTIVSDFCRWYEHSLTEAIERLKEKYKSQEELEVIEWIISICNKYAFSKDNELKKEFIIEDLKKQKKEEKNKTQGIEEIDFYENEIPKNAKLFILGANEGIFPKIKKEEEYLNDKEKIELNLNTTSETNIIEKNRCHKKLKVFKNIYLSYPKKDGSLELYPSSMIEDIKYEIEDSQDVYHNSNQYNLLTLGKKLDNLRKYGTNDKVLKILKNTYPNTSYNAYQNDYTKVAFPRKEIKLSYSSLDTFFHCAFRYYLDNVLHLNQYEEKFDQKVGTLFHEVLKDSYKEKFDFEKSWNFYIQKMEIENVREKFFLQKLKKDLKRILETLSVQENEKKFHVKLEETVTLDFKEAKLTGIIDKIFWLNKNNQTLVSIVDYKTGNPKLSLNEIPYGLSLQLPIYLLLLKKLPFQNIKVIGFYLQKILPSIPERDHIHTEEDLKRKKLMLQGYSTDEESYLKEFDPTYENSKLIASMKVSSKGFYSYAKVLSDEQMKKLETITLDKISEAINEIKNNNFAINPKRISGNLIGCDYCRYQSICFRKEKNIVNLKELKMSEFLGGEKNANMDEGAE